MINKVFKSIDFNGNNIINKNMFLFLFGKLVSLLGSRMMSFAIGLYVLTITGSGMSFAFSMIISTIPAIILSPLAGAIADKSNRKLIVVLMDFLSGALLLGIFLVSRIYGLTMILIYTTIFFLSVFNTFFSVAIEASIPNIVDEERLTKVNSYNSSINSLATILGPVLGGFVFGFISIETFIGLNGISFILSGISEMFIDFRLGAKENKSELSTEDKSIFLDIKAGFQYIKTKKVIFITLIFSIYINFVFSAYSVALPYIINNKLGLTSEQYGFIQAAFAIGSLLFSILFPIISEKKDTYFLIILGLFTTSFFMMITGIPTLVPFKTMGTSIHLIYFILINFIVGSSLIFINLPFFIMLQRETTDEYRGRVNGLLWTMSLSISPLGMLIGGLLVDFLPSIIVPLISGILFFILTVILHKQSELKKLL